MTQPASPAQLRKIHTLARQVGLDEDMRRDPIAREAGGKRSTKELDIREAVRVIDCLAKLPAARPKPKARGALVLDGPYIGVVRALWISGWHLGVVRDRTDKAMVAFVERQTGLGHAGWLRDPKDARKVIEALKKWLEREGGVSWAGDETDARGRKLAVYLALRRKLTAAGVDPNFTAFPGRVGVASMDEARIEQLTRAGGDRLRQAAG